MLSEVKVTVSRIPYKKIMRGNALIDLPNVYERDAVEASRV